MYPVSGQIQFADGSPVRHGTVELESVEHGTTASGTIDHDGSFVLGTYTQDDGAAAGEHRVIVVQMVIADGSFKHTIDHGRQVPTRFADYDRSSLTVQVKADSQNDITIVLPE
ncbi:MAG: hypothetical protein Fues2KO_13620 [Fuerstiella sp.]